VSGAASVETFAGVFVCPLVKRADGGEITDQDRGLAILAALRSVGDTTLSLWTLSQALRCGETHVLDVRVNDERICRVRLVP